MKVAVIGGGSSYTPELIKGFLERTEHFPMTELWLVDVLPERLEVVGGFAQRMVEAAGSPFAVHLTTDQREGIKGAAYVTTQLRVGWMEARKNDEYLGLRHGLIGQETTGIGGMAKALRTIPVILKIARDIEELAPGAMLVNFTNPAGLNAEALSRHATGIQAVGVCNVPITAKMEMLKYLEEQQGTKIDPTMAELQTLGLNHLSWHRGLTVNGKNVWPAVLKGFLDEVATNDETGWDINTIKTLQLIPNYYLQYFYHTDHKLEAQSKWPPSRAEQVMEIEKRLLAEYAESNRNQPPEDLMERGGAYYSTVATQLLNAHYNDLNETHVVNVAHRGAVPGWAEDWVLEIPAKVGRNGVTPIATTPLPQVCFGLIAQVKSYELLTVEAAVHGDYDAAYQAMLAHPLGPSADKIKTVLDDLLEINKPYLPQFFS